MEQEVKVTVSNLIPQFEKFDAAQWAHRNDSYLRMKLKFYFHFHFPFMCIFQMATKSLGHKYLLTCLTLPA